MLRSFRVYLVALVTFIAGLALAGGFAASAGASPKYAPKITAKAPYTARGSVGEAYVKDAVPGSKPLTLPLTA